MAQTFKEKMEAAAAKAGVEVTVTQHPKGQGEITLLPGVRRPERRQ